MRENKLCDIINQNRYIEKRRQSMKYNYDKLWKILIDKKMIKKDLMHEASITLSTIEKKRKQQNASLEVLSRICKALKCDIGDILEIKY